MTDNEWSDFYSRSFSDIRRMPMVFSSSLMVIIRTLESQWIKYSTLYWLNQKQPQTSTGLKCDAAYKEFETTLKAFNLHYMRAKLMNG